MDWGCILIPVVAVVTSPHAVGFCRNNMSLLHALWQFYVSLKMRECLTMNLWGFSKRNMGNYPKCFSFLMKYLSSGSITYSLSHTHYYTLTLTTHTHTHYYKGT